MMAAKIIDRVVVTRKEILYDHPTAGAEIRAALAAISGKPDFRLPFAQETITIEIEGVHLTVPNALRRALKDEMRGQCLTFAPNDYDRAKSTDPFMDEDFLRLRIEMIPIRRQIPEDVVESTSFKLDVMNASDTTMAVYSGDLIPTSAAARSTPLFNPTFELAILQRGRSLCINNIHIMEGYGNKNAAFTVCVRAVAHPLDLEELPREQTHPVGAPAAAKSGFVQSSFVSNPRRHRLMATCSAVLAGEKTARFLVVEACESLIVRLRAVQSILESATLAAAEKDADGITHRTANASLLITPDGPRTKGILSINNETATIGMLLARLINELSPEIGHVHEEEIIHEHCVKIVVAHAVSEPKEICAIINQAVRHALKLYNQIRLEMKHA